LVVLLQGHSSRGRNEASRRLLGIRRIEVDGHRDVVGGALVSDRHDTVEIEERDGAAPAGERIRLWLKGTARLKETSNILPEACLVLVLIRYLTEYLVKLGDALR